MTTLKFQYTNTTDNVRIYLHEIGRIPLLSRSQEVAYGQQVQLLMSLLEAKDALTLKMGREPTHTEWAEHVQLSTLELKSAVLSGQQAKEKMVSANLRLVVAIAKKYQNRGLELMDLIQEGTIGLQRGVEKFAPNKGFKLSTYVYWWITQAITHALAQKSRTIRLPIHIIEKINKIKKVRQKLSQELGRIPTVSELAKELRLEPQQVRQCLEWMQKPQSLNLCIGSKEDTELGDLLEDTLPEPSEIFMHSCLKADIESLVAFLTPQQREVIGLRFGLVDGHELSLTQVGARLNLSRERVRQVEKVALMQLRRHERLLQDYR